MEQRPPRLGDIVDDYCPRERRITNHAIVAIVENAIRQTRCTTCDAEHVFREGREPRKRRKDPASLFDQVLADVTTVPGRVAPRAQPNADPAPEGAPAEMAAPGTAQAPAAPIAAAPIQATPDDSTPDAQPADEPWPSHRRLIRASLPKTDGEPPAPRPIPEFTMHQRPPARGGRHFRPGQGRDTDGNVMGNGRDGRFGRPAHGGHGFGNGYGNGNGNNPAPDGGRGGRGRSGRRRGHHTRGR